MLEENGTNFPGTSPSVLIVVNLIIKRRCACLDLLGLIHKNIYQEELGVRRAGDKKRSVTKGLSEV